MRDRLPAPVAALPLAVLYTALAALYVWQALRHATPTIFTDEIEFTQVSRSIADGNGAAFRGGVDAGFPGLYPYLAAPAWWLDSVGQAYGVIKVLGALLMTTVLFPTYVLARMLARAPTRRPTGSASPARGGGRTLPSTLRVGGRKALRAQFRRGTPSHHPLSILSSEMATSVSDACQIRARIVLASPKATTDAASRTTDAASRLR